VIKLNFNFLFADKQFLLKKDVEITKPYLKLIYVFLN